MEIKSNVNGICPFCGEPTMGIDDITFDIDRMYYPWKCLNCNHEGVAEYSLKFIRHSVYDEEGDLIEIEDDMIKEEE